jgi:predicted amidohydrolase
VNKLRIGACQTPEIIGDIERVVSYIQKTSSESKVDILLFPECFLQGYLVSEEHIKRYALNISSIAFQKVLDSLGNLTQTLVFGLIEEDLGKYYNSVAVVQNGCLLAVYRKHFLMQQEQTVFDNGGEYPAFQVKGQKVGIAVCSDTRYPDPFQIYKALGVSIVLVPAQNMLPRESAEKWKDKHNEIRAQYAQKFSVWVISSDVTGKRGKTHVAYGPTAIINPNGDVIARVPLMEIGMVTTTIIID